MTQTPVEWLFQKLWDEPKDKLTWYSLREKAIQMEKEQNNKTTNMDLTQEKITEIMKQNKLTAVQWLVNEIFAGHTEEWQKEIDIALFMETDQITKAYLDKEEPMILEICKNAEQINKKFFKK